MASTNSIDGDPTGRGRTAARALGRAPSLLDAMLVAPVGALACPHAADDAQRAELISHLVECQIIPRLMVVHSHAGFAEIAAMRHERFAPDAIEAFALLALDVEPDLLVAHVEAMLASGIAIQNVLIDLLAPVARLLGTFWEQDRCDFVDVTMGLWRLQEVVHEIAVRHDHAAHASPAGYRALFAPMPGEQHTFGAIVIEDVFRREGWQTERLNCGNPGDLMTQVRDEWFDLIGLTVSCDCHRAPLTAVISDLRKVSRNPHVCVMVGGRIFSANPGLALEVGACGTAPDPQTAPRIAMELVRQRLARTGFRAL